MSRDRGGWLAPFQSTPPPPGNGNAMLPRVLQGRIHRCGTRPGLTPQDPVVEFRTTIVHLKPPHQSTPSVYIMTRKRNTHQVQVFLRKRNQNFYHGLFQAILELEEWKMRSFSWSFLFGTTFLEVLYPSKFSGSREGGVIT